MFPLLHTAEYKEGHKQTHLLPPSQQLPLPNPNFASDEDDDSDEEEKDEADRDDEDNTSNTATTRSTATAATTNTPTIPNSTSSPSPSVTFSSSTLLPASTSLPSPAFISQKKRRVVIVAKQLPVRTTRTADGHWKCEWEDTRNFLSALAILHTHDQIDVKWVGCPNTDTAVSVDQQEEYEDLLFDYDCIPVFVTPSLYDRFFHGFCKSVLWPLFHYVMPKSNEHFGEMWDDHWQAYTAANSLYASVVTHAVETPTDIIWIQNYHLLLLPSFLRTKLPRAKIGLFIHTPFPSSDVFRVLPTRHNILSSMLATDLIGFHTFDYARHFLSCIKRVMDLDFETMAGGALGVKYNGRFVSILISHVGIDSRKFKEDSESQQVEGQRREIEERTGLNSGSGGSKQLILSVDDYDVVKGVIMKILAFRHFLATYPEWRDKVRIVQLLHTAGGKDESDMRDRVLGEIASINAEYGNPITVIDGELSMLDMVAYYSTASVCVVSTFWDGLNLTPYEFSASQRHERPGALIISEFMGCSRSLNGVIRVNPWSLVQMADAIVSALNMTDDERRVHHARRFNYVMNHSIQRWGLGYLEQLDKATKFQSSLSYVQVGWGSNVKLMGLRSDFAHLEDDAITVAYRKANKRVLLLDYDGTLTPLEKSSERSALMRPTAEIKKILRALCDDDTNCVFIMSGRTRSVLTAWFEDMPQLGLAAEKGLFLRWPVRWMETHRMDDWQPNDSKSEREELEQKRREKEATGDSHNNISPSAADSTSTDTASHSHLLSDDTLSTVITNDWECLISLDDTSWKQTALSLIASYTEQTDGSWIEPKEYAIVWHYENADPEYGRMQASELQKYLIKLLGNPSVDVVKYDYARVLEVKPHGISKGLAANAILESYLLKAPVQRSMSTASMASLARESTGGSLSPVGLGSGRGSSSLGLNVDELPVVSADSRPTSPQGSPNLGASYEFVADPFLLCVGDDRSDEDMFVAVNTKQYLRAAGTERMDGLGDGTGGGAAAAAPDEAKWGDAELIRNRNPPSPFTFTVCVGMKPSNAHYYLHDDEEVLKTLHSLATCSERIQQSKLHRNHSTNSFMPLQRTQTLPPTTQLAGSQTNLAVLVGANSLSVAGGERALRIAAMAKEAARQAAASRAGSTVGLNGANGSSERKAVSEEDEDDDLDDESGEEYEYGSGDEDGETIGV